jgi:hypothetical protein
MIRAELGPDNDYAGEDRPAFSSERAGRFTLTNLKLTAIKILCWDSDWCQTLGGRLSVESVRSCSCENREAGSCGRGQFGKPKERESPMLEAATKQLLVNMVAVAGDSSETQRKGDVRCWKPLLSNG